MRQQPIPILQPIVHCSGNFSVKLGSASTQHVARIALEYAAGLARSMEDGKLEGGPAEYVKAAETARQGFRDAEATVEGASDLLEAKRLAIKILEGTAADYPAGLAAEPLVACALEMRSAADSLLSVAPNAAEADLSEVLHGLREAEQQLAIDIETAKRKLGPCEAEARRCVGAAWAACDGHPVARQRFAEHSLKDFLPTHWPKGIQPSGAKQLVADAVSQRRLTAHEKRNERRRHMTPAELAVERARAADAAAEARNQKAAENIHRIMGGGK
ncbi:hypothetical protein [Paracoccus ravus]|uniref:hypothetical protein n=1 Tax=Paracoccus ravus TaxID=2447760 RepID=UPI00106E10AA|nr:hypothetical protein [Paracoccus ravus]